jgi:hypothetical protein
MKIELKEITIKKLTDGFADNAEQESSRTVASSTFVRRTSREFIYKDKQRDAVIDSVRKDFPLNGCTGRCAVTANTK